MRPQEYLSELKSKYSSRRIEPSDLPANLRTQVEKWGWDLDTLCKTANEGDYAERLLKGLESRLKLEWLKHIESGFIAVGSIPNPLPNAYSEKVGDNGYAIVFHDGLKDFLFRVARILATRFISRGGEEVSPPQVPGIEETARIVAEIFWWYQETSQSFGPDYPITPSQILLASQLAREAETFLLAHEIAHAILDARIQDVSPELSSEHLEEHTADAIGLRVVMDLEHAADKPLVAAMRYAGAEFAFQIFRALETLGLEFHGSHTNGPRN